MIWVGFLLYSSSKSIEMFIHSHKKRKDSLEGSWIGVPEETSSQAASEYIRCELYYLCDQLLGAMIYLHFIESFFNRY